jgi:hypothetical protein
MASHRVAREKVFRGAAGERRNTGASGAKLSRATRRAFPPWHEEEPITQLTSARKFQTIDDPYRLDNVIRRSGPNPWRTPVEVQPRA